MAKKCILVLLDGLGDRSHTELDGLTPLQAADTPVLDRLARKGVNGLFHAARLGQALPSENAHFALFGYDMADFPGRGALEALGAGIPLNPDEVAVLAHFVAIRPSADGTLMLEDGNPPVTGEEIRELARAVGTYSLNGVRIRLHPTGGIRAVLILAGGVSPFVTDSDPITNGRPLIAVTPWSANQGDPPAQDTAHALCAYLEWAVHSLQNHPINRSRRKKNLPPLNGLVTQRAGRLKPISSFPESYGLRGLSISSQIVYQGLAEFLGMDARRVSDSARPEDDLAERLQLAGAELGDYDFVHVHTKMPDEAAHTKDPIYKCRIIEAMDRGLGAALPGLIADPELILAVGADHSTPSSGPLVHSGEPVPLLFHGPGIRRDRVRRYDEVHAAGGALGFVYGKEFMYLVLNYLDRAKLQGIMDTPVDQPYWPGRCEPFRLQQKR